MPITPTRIETYGRSHQYTWIGLTPADGIGEAITAPGAADASVHVHGTFGGSSVSIEGSNEETPTDWQILRDHIGDPITFAASGLVAIAENTLHIRPVMTGGAGASVSVHILRRNTV